MKTIDPPQAREKKEKGEALFLDVRTPAEIRESAIEDCLCVPHDRVSDCPNLEALSREQPLVLVCGSGKRAAMAGEALESKGFHDLSVMEGGIQQWKENDLPVKKGRGAISLERQVRIAAGAMVALGSVLAFFNPLWLILPCFVGSGLVFAGVTDTCGMGMMLAKMPWNR